MQPRLDVNNLLPFMFLGNFSPPSDCKLINIQTANALAYYFLSEMNRFVYYFEIGRNRNLINLLIKLLLQSILIKVIKLHLKSVFILHKFLRISLNHNMLHFILAYFLPTSFTLNDTWDSSLSLSHWLLIFNKTSHWHEIWHLLVQKWVVLFCYWLESCIWISSHQSLFYILEIFK